MSTKIRIVNIFRFDEIFVFIESKFLLTFIYLFILFIHQTNCLEKSGIKFVIFKSNEFKWNDFLIFRLFKRFKKIKPRSKMLIIYLLTLIIFFATFLEELVKRRVQKYFYPLKYLFSHPQDKILFKINLVFIIK